jgi:hypothetical protein
MNINSSYSFLSRLLEMAFGHSLYINIYAMQQLMPYKKTAYDAITERPDLKISHISAKTPPFALINAIIYVRISILPVRSESQIKKLFYIIMQPVNSDILRGPGDPESKHQHLLSCGNLHSPVRPQWQLLFQEQIL